MTRNTLSFFLFLVLDFRGLFYQMVGLGVWTGGGEGGSCSGVNFMDDSMGKSIRL